MGESHSMNTGGGGCSDAEREETLPHSFPFHPSHRGMMTSAPEVPQSVSPELLHVTNLHVNPKLHSLGDRLLGEPKGTLLLLCSLGAHDQRQLPMPWPCL